MIVLRNLLTPQQVASIATAIAHGPFVSGTMTEELRAAGVKYNLQLAPTSPAAAHATNMLMRYLQDCISFQTAVWPDVITPPMFCRYETGMEYGAHIDSPRMQDVRCDVAVTVCLSDSYSGGELVVDVDGASVTWKGSIGDCVVYAADTTHMVTPVGHGVREVAVFWVQSLVRNPAHRRLLFDLRTALDEAQHGTNNTPAHIAKLERIYANLVRYWI